MPVTAEQVKALIRRHVEGDDQGFYSVALQVAARAAREGQSRFARELRELIDAAKDPAAHQLRPTPIAQPRGELAGLMSVSYPATSLKEMILTPVVDQRLRQVVLEQRQRDRLAEHGLEPVHRLLLLGPPGTGKSMSAGALAHELSLPLFTIQLDALISKYMGETATKLRLIFDAIATSRGVYFFDEFDALGAERAARNDVGEARRVLNSFLQFLDEAASASLVVAATNHAQLLDRALFRRFDEVIEFGLPEPSAAIEIMRKRLGALDVSQVNWTSVGVATDALSQGDLVRAAASAAKQALLQSGSGVVTEDLVAALNDRRRESGG